MKIPYQSVSMKKYIFVFLFLTIGVSVSAEMEFNPDISKWIEIERPMDKRSGDRAVFRYRAGYSELHWRVKEKGGRIDIGLNGDEPDDPKPEFNPRTKKFREGHCFLKVKDGWLVGFNYGEFGAELRWFSLDGKKSYQISNDQINQFIKVDDQIYAVQGLAHMGLGRGSFVKIELLGNRWNSIEQVKFDQSPEAIMVEEAGSFLIVLTDSLIRVDKDLNEKIIVESADWGTLYPSSIASNHPRYAYIGMRQFVVRVDLEDGKMKFLVPEIKFLNKLPPKDEKQIWDQWEQFRARK